QAIAALAAGKHVAIQKPLTVDLASADRILAAAHRGGVVFKVTENYVFYPPIVRARELIRDGAIGDPVSMRIQFVSGTEGGWEVPASAWAWRMQEARAGRGPSTFDHGHHLWSTAWYLLGEPERVTGWVDSLDGLVDCPAQFLWKVEGARRYGVIQFHHGERLRVPSRYYSNDEWIDVFGSRGILSIRRCTGNVQDGPALVLYDGHRHVPVDVESDWGLGFLGATRDFIAAIRDGTEPCLTGEQARTVLRFSLAAGRAARLRREVFVDELDRGMPGLYSWRRRRRERREAAGGEGLLARLLPGQGTAQYAGQAVELTRALVAGFRPTVPPVPDTTLGLILRGDGLAEVRLGLLIRDNAASLVEGAVPEGAGLTVTMAPGLWAAILMKKKRIEMAVLQGRISFTGRVEEALRLRDGFGL
ncbi:MAG: Gfo/Idh/MocA family oxidoreductase, partial [Deltaproteobacteria bacterium]|nr:Gfo/Idh/MocA family oxidoreductase [Deltaproteobacteria bacterium]